MRRLVAEPPSTKSRHMSGDVEIMSKRGGSAKYFKLRNVHTIDNSKQLRDDCIDGSTG